MQNFFEYYKDSGLGKWLDEKWVDISRKDKSGKHPPCGASAKKGTRKKNQKKAYPKCRPASKAAAMSDELKKKATQQKRRAETKKKHKKGRKPVWVSHENLKEYAMLNESKNTPNNPKLWSKAKSLAKKKFDVYPSAYANLWASKWYKEHGGTWSKKSKNESTFVSFGDWLNNKHGDTNTLNEWMSFRQANEQDATSEYTFSGTYNTETIPDLKENSKLISVEQALSIIPPSYNTQFSNTAKLEAGKSLNEENKEVVWISIEDQGVTYLFEKN